MLPISTASPDVERAMTIRAVAKGPFYKKIGYLTPRGLTGSDETLLRSERES